MATTVTQPDRSSHRVIPDVRPKMAKAAQSEVRKSDQEWRQAVGRLVEALRRSRGWTLDEFAGKLEKDPRQVARWEKGEERPQFDAILTVEELHQPFLLALADLLQHCVETETTIRIRRRA